MNHDYLITNVIIHYKSCHMIIHTSVLTMTKPSWWLRQVIFPIRKLCTTVFDGLPKFMNQLWIIYHLPKNKWFVSSMQLLMHRGHVQYKWYRCGCFDKELMQKKIINGTRIINK